MAVKRIEHIDVWRFVAVMLVIQEHFLLFSGVDRYFAPIKTYSLQIERLGELGVLIFFSISGFVICTALKAEKNSSGKICLSAFYTRRFFRIIPPLWLYLFVLALLSTFDVIKISSLQILTSAAFLCNFPFENGCSWFAGHTWSLADEEQFYLVFPLLFLWAWRGNKQLHLAAIISSLTLAAVAFQYFKFDFSSDYCSDFLFLLTGCFTAFLSPNWMQKLRSLPFLCWLFALILLVYLLNVLPNGQDAYFKMLFYPVLIQVIVFGTPTYFAQIKNIFENASLSYLGRISYSVYLWQELATAYYENTPWWMNLVYLGLVFLFAALSFRYFEMPCQKLGTRLSNRFKAASI